MELELTQKQYQEEIAQCRQLFLAKMSDYGHSWRILRPTSLTDQLLIKARRIRSIEIAGIQKVEDSVDQDFIGLVNYGIMAIIQLRHPTSGDGGPESDGDIIRWYDQIQREIEDLMVRKNHDYGEVWREMRISSMTDLILMKLLRIKQIEDQEGRTIVSEGLDANYADIVNYSIFALILRHHTNIHP
ncbi:MAG: DUF1599 domain-containing protein [Saprospiraceae bacterium]|nr:DUF1599 domain-containing protein [Saprospiraceae bacterium]